MKKLSKKGYKIEIKQWVGNFGNHLLQLSGALKVAIETQSILAYPANKLIPENIFDFRDNNNYNCDLLVRSCFFYHDECFQYPLIYDQERRNISIKYILPLLKNKCNETLKSDLEIISETTLVINVRSGDIFREDYDSEEATKSGIKNYVQPPLSFYRRIIDKFNYEDILIITQPDNKNPVVSELLKLYDIKLHEHTNPLNDFIMLMNAKNLVTCHSSFSWFSALMSTNLKVLHQPASFSIKGVKDFDIYSYYVNNYIKHGEWKPTVENFNIMITLPVENINFEFMKANPKLTFTEMQLSTFAAKRGWVPDNGDEPSVYVQSIISYNWSILKKFVRPRTRLSRFQNRIKSK